MLTFNEQLRQMEIAEQKRKSVESKEKKSSNCRALPSFIPSVLLYCIAVGGKRSVKSRTIRVPRYVISLLFLFEFIVLLIHPYIGHWTHESPVWMLLILVTNRR